MKVSPYDVNALHARVNLAVGALLSAVWPCSTLVASRYLTVEWTRYIKAEMLLLLGFSATDVADGN